MGAPGRVLSAPSLTAWVLSDGKAGDEAQGLGLVEAMGLAPSLRRVSPRTPFRWLMPWGPVDPGEAPGRPESPVAPPFPDLLVASGRRAVPYLRAVRRASGGRTFTVFLKDPRTGAGTADLIWVPAHDRLRGPNVLSSVTGPHRVSAALLAAARARPDPRLSALPGPRVAVLVGGDSRHHRFRPHDVERFAQGLAGLVSSGASLMITTSRRTPLALSGRLASLADEPRIFLWDGTGENPYLSMLALCDAVVASADSTNMIGEAVATGAPVLVFEPSGGHPKITAFLQALSGQGAVHPFTGTLEGARYHPLDTTPALAEAALAALQRHRAALRAGRPEL